MNDNTTEIVCGILCDHCNIRLIVIGCDHIPGSTFPPNIQLTSDFID